MNTSVNAIYCYTKKKLQEEVEMREKSEELMEYLKRKHKEETLGLEKIMIEERMKTLRRRIRDCDGERLTKYEEDMKPILLRYKSLGPIIYDFDTGRDEKEEKRVLLFQEALLISRRYITIQLQFGNCMNNETRCQCGGSSYKFEKTHNGTLQCPECGASLHGVVKRLLREPAVDSTIKRMRDSIQYFQGKGVNIINSKVMEKIKSHCRRRYPHLLRNVEHGVYNDNQNHKNLYGIMSECGMSKFNDHINLIGHYLWGWNLPDVSDVECEIIELFIIFTKHYMKVKKNRSSSLGNGFMKYQLFMMVGKSFPLSWFKIVEGQDRLEQYEQLTRATCASCNDPRIKFTPIPR